MKTKESTLLTEAQPWLESLRASGRAQDTLIRYGRSVGMAAEFWKRNQGPCSVREITPRNLQDWMAELQRYNYAASSVDCWLRPLALYLRWMEERGEIFSNPARLILLRNPPRRMLPVCSEQDIARTIDGIAGNSPVALRDRAILEVFYATGMRLGESFGLELNDLNLRDKVVQVRGKGAKERTLPLTSRAVEAIRAYLDNGRPRLARQQSLSALWLAKVPKGNGDLRLGRSGIIILVHLRGRAARIRLSPHGLRRAFATHLLRRGLGVNELRMLLGHAGFQHIRHYVRYAAVDLKRAHQRSKLSR